MGSDRFVHISLRVLGILGLLGILVASLLGSHRPIADDQQAPPVERARYLDGTTVTLDLTQGRPIVVNIWATWCPPCLHEMPMFAEAAKAYGEKVEFYGLAVDSDVDRIKDIVTRIGVTYDIAEIDQRTARAWNATALPSTYIVDGKGVVRWSVRGEVDRKMLDDALAPLLQAP